MAAAALRRTAKSLPGGASSQSCSPSSGQTAEGNQRGRASVLDYEHMQRTALTGAQHQPDTCPPDQPLDGSVQYQQAGSDQIPLTTETGSEYQVLGTGVAADMSAQYLQAGEGSISNAIVDAQLTHPISRDDGAEMPDASLTQDVIPTMLTFTASASTAELLTILVAPENTHGQRCC